MKRERERKVQQGNKRARKDMMVKNKRSVRRSKGKDKEEKEKRIRE